MEHEAGISVVIPCLNEEDSIEQVVHAALDGIASVNLPGEVIVVDNGSQDLSRELAEKAGARVVSETKRGYGSAIRKGFSVANHSILIMADGDLTYDLTRMADLVSPILKSKADFVIGNRMNDIRPGAMPFLNRHVGNPCLSLFLRLLFGGKDIHDSQCGLRAIRKDAYNRLNCVTTGMEFATEMIIRALAIKLRISECDIVYHPRLGNSKLRPFRDAWRHVRFMLLCSPSFALILPSSLLWTLTLLATILLATGPVKIRSQYFDLHTMLLLGLLHIASIQLMTGGMIAKAYAHLSGFRHDPIVAWFYENFSFRLGSTVSLILTALGLGGIAATILVVGPWHFDPSGNMDAFRILFFCVICIVDGVQMAVASYLFSVMALPRHLDAMPPAIEATATQDL